jgi:hypothetical protein
MGAWADVAARDATAKMINPAVRAGWKSGKRVLAGSRAEGDQDDHCAHTPPLITLGGLRPNALFAGHSSASMSILLLGPVFLARRGADYRAGEPGMITFDGVDHLGRAGLGSLLHRSVAPCFHY